MKLRLWILALMTTCFLGGLAGGVLVSFRVRPAQTDPAGPFADYEALLVREFELDSSPTRLRGLRAVLQRYHQDVEDVRARTLAAVEPELRQLGATCNDRIRDRVLRPDQRQRFDRMTQGFADPGQGTR